MSSESSERASAQREPAPPARAAQLHVRSFKLRFATQHELGRSDVSAVKPLGLPAVVSAKFYAREPASEPCGAERALRRVRRLFHARSDGAPVTSAQEYGWWWKRAKRPDVEARRDPRLQHHLCDSAWLKERLRVLATDDGLKRR